ncbi:dihydrolipoamide acetyltransferase family protein [Nigerium massiliense]|uniref:dihydrolipoamide acetyltransferase family protein n=1 Tax=Nigerium massiliense TaxID=1522317 RepID=UPI001C48C17F|nr:dihydrolipoamide acetyltransferase family protein [Nigerium massiliense]
MPDPGEGLLEAEIVRWIVEPGQDVAVNDPMIEIETAKSLVELPSPYAGVVHRQLVAEGDVVAVGQPILLIDDGSGDAPDEPAAAEAQPEGRPEAADQGDAASGSVLVGYGTSAAPVSRRPRSSSGLQKGPEGEQVHESYSTETPVSRHVEDVTEAHRVEDEPTEPPLPEPGNPRSLEQRTAGRDASGHRPLAKPVVRRLARDLGVDLATVTGTGPDGTVTNADVAAAAAGGGPRPGEVRRIPLRGVRRQMVASMSASVEVPQASLWLDVDVTETVALIEALKKRPEFGGLRISPILVLAKAVCLAIARHPEVNGSLDTARQEIVVPSDINLGIAAATARGLVVPNVKRANTLNLVELATALNAIVAAARESRITPADCAHGTFTITNVGVFGIEGGTPILNPGEAAILCMGTIARRPWVVGTGEDERMEPRSICTLTLTIDHRVLDGEMASRFLADVATVLRDPGLSMLF